MNDEGSIEMEPLVDQWIKRIHDLNSMMTDAINRENLYELLILLEQRGKSIESLYTIDVMENTEQLNSLVDDTQQISDQIQRLISKYEQAMQSLVKSTPAIKAYTVSMALTQNHNINS